LSNKCFPNYHVHLEVGVPHCWGGTFFRKEGGMQVLAGLALSSQKVRSSP